MSKYFKTKKAGFKLDEKAPPRSLDEITKEYNNECWALGQLEYQIHVLKRDAALRNTKIERLNYEADERKKLDSANPPKPEQTQGATSET